ncbi:MAG: M23 family metallopeptidase [Candidatus Omnitrophica bacterium]|nr:M23 family metallopeptidase [Candidatus Omnitrophota bacterium]
MRRWSSGHNAAVFIGLACLAGLGLYELSFTNYVHFVTPVAFDRTVSSGALPIRFDEMGDGYFGAPRVGGRKHRGIDLAAAVGTPVRAVWSGRVIKAMDEGKYGEHVRIQHANGLVSIYAHLSRMHVATGRRVRQGAVIGEVGKTGNAAYDTMVSHLHFELVRGDRRLNPTSYVEEGISEEGTAFLRTVVRRYVADAGTALLAFAVRGRPCTAEVQCEE